MALSRASLAVPLHLEQAPPVTTDSRRDEVAQDGMSRHPAMTQVTDEDRRFMQLALAEAEAARAADEVPIGAVVTLDGEVVARAHNLTRTRKDPTAHAELIAIAEACRTLDAMRIPGAVVYTTVEPCFMCAGALSHARVARVVWGVRDPKFGGCASLGNVLSDERLNHQVEIIEGVCADEARTLLQEFFREKRGNT